MQQSIHSLGNQGRGRARFVLPVWWQDSLDLVVASQSVDTGLDQNQTELAVNILAVALQMLADRDGLLDQEVQILRDVGLQANGLHDTQDLQAQRERIIINNIDYRNPKSNVNNQLPGINKSTAAPLAETTRTNGTQKWTGILTFLFVVGSLRCPEVPVYIQQTLTQFFTIIPPEIHPR